MNVGEIELEKLLENAEQDFEKWTEYVANREWKLTIGGSFSVGRGESVTIHNPSTNESIGFVSGADETDVEAAVAQAEAAASDWANLPPRARGEIVRRFADVLAEHAEELAWLDTLEAGLPLWMMRKDAETGIERMRMFADFSLSLTGQTIPASTQNLHLTFPVPFGVVARIIPYNHPFMFAASKLAAPLVAGNAVILKPSELTPLSALRMGELAEGILPPGVLSVLVGGPAVGEALVRHKSVRRIAFTGSHQIGRQIQRSGADVGVKHVSLELGGKNALIAFSDVAIDEVVQAAVKGMNFAFTGQSCGSTSRVLVHETLLEEFTERLVAEVKKVKVGLPWQDGTKMGPLISNRQKERTVAFVERALAEGAAIRTGEDVHAGEGHFVYPTVLTGVTPAMEIAQEEVFGPVVSLIPFSTEEEAVAIANGVDYGLTGSVWTNDINRAHRVAQALKAGYVWINDTSTHFPGVPFGGSKLSGIGREESVEELLSYTEIKAINVVIS